MFVEKGELRFSKINITDFNHENIPNEKLVVSDCYSNENFKSVLNGSGQKSHKCIVPNTTSILGGGNRG